MIIDGNKLKNNPTFDTQLCICGAGVAGIILANELKDTYEEIILLDSGGERYSPEVQELNQAEKVSQYFPDPLYSRLRMIGGASNHWENNTSPFYPIDFEKRDWVPNSGWPISYDELTPYYKKAEWYCGVGQDGYDSEYWAKVLNKKDPCKDSLLLESRIAKASIPPVRFYEAYGELLNSSPKVKILTYSTVVDAIYDEAEEKLEKVICVNKNGTKYTVHANNYIFTMGAIQNTRMMLAFNQKYDQQLGNRGGVLGAYLMEHPTPRAAHLITDKQMLLNFYQGSVLSDKSVVGFLSLSDKALKDNKTTNLRMPLIPKKNYILSRGISSSHILKNSLSTGDLPDDMATHLYNVVSDIDMVIEGVARKSFDIKLYTSSMNSAPER